MDLTVADGVTRLRLRSLADPDLPFRERCDSSGDLCLREPSRNLIDVVAALTVCFAADSAEIDGRRFLGFRYWYECASAMAAIHRLLDRQSWELGGDLTDVTLICRNLYEEPCQRISRKGRYSTNGFQAPSGLLLGVMLPRWALLPPFDLYHSPAGNFLGCFAEAGCIRSVIESAADEDAIRHTDLQFFPSAKRCATIPRRILPCPDVLDDVAAANMWTRRQDEEQALVAARFGLPPEAPPAIAMSIGEMLWKNFHSDHSYEDVIAVAAESATISLAAMRCGRTPSRCAASWRYNRRSKIRPRNRGREPAGSEQNRSVSLC